jgi:UDP-3-O-[3-hydroxymyristoyl] glucosamine N-acyltransferase
MTVGEVADWIGATVEGDDRCCVTGLASIDDAGSDELTFAADPQYLSRLPLCRAAAVIVPADATVVCDAVLLRVAHVPAAVAELLKRLAGPEDLPPAGVHPSAVVSDEAELADGAAVGPLAVIAAGARIASGAVVSARAYVGSDVEIGERTVLAEGVVVRQGCRIGRRCRIGPNSVIGYDGFGYYTTEGTHHRIVHAGTVVIEDDVDLGACVCVDRAKFSRTRIGAGTKVDNLVQIAHNVDIGPGSIIVAQVGIAGSTRLGHHVVLGGAASIRDNIELGDLVKVAGRSAVMRDVPAEQAVAGAPAYEGKHYFRMIKALEKLPELLRDVRRLGKRVDRLDESADD